MYFPDIEVLLQMGCPYNADSRISSEERYIGDNNYRLGTAIVFLCWCIVYTFPYPVFTSLVLFGQGVYGLPLIYIFVPDGFLYLFLSRMVLKLPTAGNTSITYFVLV